MGRQVKCPYCETQLDKDEAYSYKKKYYHENCFKLWNSEKEHRKSLIEYICKLYKIDVPNGMILKQIKDFQEEYKYKLSGIELALRYFYETLGNHVQEGAGIGIVPFVYEEAKQHYIKQMKISESIINLNKAEEKTVFIDLNQSKRKSRSIDIAAI